MKRGKNERNEKLLVGKLTIHEVGLIKFELKKVRERWKL